MKLSEMTTDRAMDALCVIIPAAGNICSDPKLSTMVKQLAAHKMAELKTIAQKIVFCTTAINDFLPILLKDHRQDVYTILAELNDSPVEKIKNQTVLQTISQIKEAAQDPELLALFSSQGQKGDAESSGSASVKAEET